MFTTTLDSLIPVGQKFLEMIQPDNHSLTKTAENVENLHPFREIGHGAVKIVWAKRSNINPPTEEGKKFSISGRSVYYTAMPSIFGGAKKELRSEFEKMSAINGKLKNVEQGSTAHLAVEGKEMEGDKRIDGEYTLKVDRALMDYEKKLLEKMPLPERILFGGHLLNGLTNLHLVDYTHGDMKPENCLIYENEGEISLKLADLGKAKETVGDETALYSGNLRYAPPEGMQSKKGDVFGAALILIRNFEEEYLNNGASLIEIKQKDRDMEASPNLRGIERFVVENNAFLASNEGFNLDVLARRAKMLVMPQSAREMEVGEVHLYIDALREHLAKDARFQPDQVDGLSQLLKDMTHVDPQKRISSAQAEQRYNKIFQ